MTALPISRADRPFQARPHTVPLPGKNPAVRPGLPLCARHSVAFLVLAAVLWGSGNVACKTVLQHTGPLTALACRSALGLAFVLCVLRLEPGGKLDWRWLKSALLASVLLTGAVLLQQISYRWTSVTNASFLVNTCAVMTPLVAWVCLGQRPDRRTMLAAGAILCGAFLMSGMTMSGARLNTGDLACLGSALLYACGMVAMGRHVMRHGRPLHISAVQFGVSTLIATPLAFGIETPALPAIMAAAPELLYLGLFSTALACILTAIAQANVSATTAATLTSGECVFGALGAFAMLGERPTTEAWIGAALILTAIAIVARTAAVAPLGANRP